MLLRVLRTYLLPYRKPLVAVAGPAEATRHLLTGADDRLSNMTAFAIAAIGLLAEQLL